ncbi:MAG TPA: hypothetical protein H9730_07330 [Candidatus Mediterraneibacter stercoripullorum]|nr:hypothetical protein [Candidatus Mediterraneibacter stercoripullorum]
MMIKKRIFLILLVVLAFVIGYILKSSITDPNLIIKDPDNANIIEIIYVLNADGESINIVDYNESVIVEYLSTCYEKRIASTMHNYQLGDYILIVTLDDGEKIKQLLLGKGEGYSIVGYPSLLNKIVNEKEVLAEMLDILQIKN